jgi:hypothetical protein
VSGIAQVQQGGISSNAMTFTVLGSGGTAVTMAPNVLKMVVGDMRSIQVLNAASQPVTGLTWTSSDPPVVSLSTDDPPVMTALSAGHVTITAGAASADVTVFADALPLGTVVWSNPGNGSGVTKIVPAVPSASGVADVFAFQGDGTVQAITSDGLTAWTADVSGALNWGRAVPDFQGGLVVMDLNANSIMKLDGITGQSYSAYTPDGNWQLDDALAVHTDGTIFAIQHDNQSEAVSVIGIDPTTGTQKFSVPVDMPSESGDLYVSGIMIGGDGYAYVPYEYREDPYFNPSYDHLRLLRVNSSGVSDNINVLDWTGPGDEMPPWRPVKMITNADSGILLSWSSWDPTPTGILGMAITNGTSVSIISAPQVPDQSGAVVPVLQAQDGSFVGTAWTGEYGDVPYLVAFDATGNVRWSVPGYGPKIATADGGVIAQAYDPDTYDFTGSAVTFDLNGSATGQGTAATPSWRGKTYSILGGSLADLAQPPPKYASAFEVVAGGNPSGNATSVPFLTFIEGMPLFAAAGKGSKCQLGGAKPALGGPALEQYASAKKALLDGNYLTSPACSAFFNAKGRDNYFSKLTSAVKKQTPYDGLQTTISMYEAGMWNAHDENKPTFPSVWQKTAVCQTFNTWIVAEAQLQPPGTDVYLNADPKVWKTYLAQSTVLHEALHNLTGLQDPALAEVLGTSLTSTGATTPINTVLVQNGCAAN